MRFHRFTQLLEVEEEKTGLRKSDQVQFMSDYLSSLFPTDEWGNNLFGELNETWDEYYKIDDPTIREYVLLSVMNNILQSTPDNPDLVKVENTISGIRCISTWVLESSDTNMLDRLYNLANENREKLNNIIWNIVNKATTGIDISFRVIELVWAVNRLLLNSRNENVLTQLQEEEQERLQPFYSLLTFWTDENGVDVALLNATYDKIIKHRLIPDLFSDPIKDNWWQELIFHETLRQSLKTGTEFRCPFLGREGVSCGIDCFIKERGRRLIGKLDIFSNESFCYS